MFEAQYMHVEAAGTLTIYGPWFTPGGAHGRFTVDIIQILNSATLEVEVLTKNTETAGDTGTLIADSGTLTAVGQHPFAPSTLGPTHSTLELVRYKYTLSVESGGPGLALFRMLPPVWFDAVKA